MVALSVHLITYNNEDFIEETLKSILKQKCEFKYEIVVGDDNSSDNTLGVIRRYAEKYPNLFHIKKNETQLGILRNFKATLDRCNGKYVFDIAGDDIFKTEDAIQKMVSAFEKNPNFGFVDSGYDRYIISQKKTEPFINRNTITCSDKDYKEAVFLGKIIPVGVCYNKDALYKYVDFDKFINNDITIEDYPILVSLVTNCAFFRINETLHEYRLHTTSYTQKPQFDRALLLRNQMLGLFNDFKVKYNFPKNLKQEFEENHYKSLLFSAGAYQNKEWGKKAFSGIQKKSLRDIIHFLASQYPFVRKAIRLRKIFS